MKILIIILLVFSSLLTKSHAQWFPVFSDSGHLRLVGIGERENGASILLHLRCASDAGKIRLGIVTDYLASSDSEFTKTAMATIKWNSQKEPFTLETTPRRLPDDTVIFSSELNAQQSSKFVLAAMHRKITLQVFGEQVPDESEKSRIYAGSILSIIGFGKQCGVKM